MNPRWAGSRPDPQAAALSVTVAICTFNDAHYLAEAIHSVLAQTRAPDEFIVIDDGSTDHTADVVAGYAEHVDIHVRPHEGLAAARNYALAITATRFLLFVDADDLLEPTTLETLVGLAARNRDGRVALYYGARREFGLRTGVQTPGPWDPNRLAHHNYICVTALLERDTIVRVGGFCRDDDGVGCEDWDLWLTLAGRGYRGRHTDAVTLSYRVRDESMTTGLLTQVTQLREVMDRRHPWVTTAGSHPAARARSRLGRLLRSRLGRGTGGTASTEQP